MEALLVRAASAVRRGQRDWRAHVSVLGSGPFTMLLGRSRPQNHVRSDLAVLRGLEDVATRPAAAPYRALRAPTTGSGCAVVAKDRYRRSAVLLLTEHGYERKFAATLGVRHTAG